MNWFVLIPLLIQYGPQIEHVATRLWATATSNEDFVDKFQHALPQAAALAKQIAAIFFPDSAPAVGAIVATVLTYNKQFITWAQQACNLAAQVGLIALPAPLVVDGLYGPKTHDAVKLLQAQLGLNADGIFGMLTKAAVLKLNLPGLPKLP